MAKLFNWLRRGSRGGKVSLVSDPEWLAMKDVRACQPRVSADAVAKTTRELAGAFAVLEPAQRLTALRNAVTGRVVFTTSFGLEDQVITHLIAEAGLDIEIVTLDTGRMFPETYTLWRDTQARYDVQIRAFFPNGVAIENLVAAQGVDGFYHSTQARQACCHARKVEPLGRALKDASAWVTGLRADASAHRAGMDAVQFDVARNLIKFSPLFDWTRDRIAAFAADHDVPVSPLHAKGFLSIGCAPCTRAVAPGEPERAGRWWWEQQGAAECGLHVDTDGRLIRALGRPDTPSQRGRA